MSPAIDTRNPLARIDIETEALALFSQRVRDVETKLQASEQKLANTIEKIEVTKQKSIDLKFTIRATSSITSSSVVFIAFSFFTVSPVAIVAGTLGTGYFAYKSVTYLIGK